jgi:TPP-dependent pyruvate/acetoin dehydrogenase alpha subunit
VVYESSDQRKMRIMAKLTGKVAVVSGGSKGVGAANAKALAFWGACWMIGLAVPVACGGR